MFEIAEDLLKAIPADRNVSKAELEALDRALKGESAKDSAAHLKISAAAVRKRLGAVYDKFDITGDKPGKFETLKSVLQNLQAERSRVLEDSTRKQLARAQQPQELAFDTYVERPPVETRCYEQIVHPGALIRIKGPKQMGKTLLLNKIFDHGAKLHYQTVSLNLLLADDEILTNLDKFLRWFCAGIGRQLQQPNQVDSHWDEKFLGSMASCTAYFEECLLANVDGPLVLGLDNVDRLFSHPASRSKEFRSVAENFFALLRGWYEWGRISENWKKLRLVIAHSTEPYISLDVNHSPFNVGLSIDLPEFSPKQVKDLAQQHGIDWNEAQVKQLMSVVGGHPYLVQQALFHLKTVPGIELAELLKTAPTEAGLYKNHLREHLMSLQMDQSLVAAMKNVLEVNGPVPLESEQTFRLSSMGLVRLRGDDVEPRCELYRLYFSNRLGVSR